MAIAEHVLLLFSRDPEGQDLDSAVNNWNEDNSLDLLDQFIPDFRALIPGKRFVDFGCGTGAQSLALLREGASRVLAVDINPEALAALRSKAQQAGLQDRVEPVERISEAHKDRFDFVISQNSMEHFPDPGLILEQMVFALKPGGRILMTFGPPWYAPYGSHMHFFTKLPWVNILFSEKTVMKVRERYRDDGATRYEDVAFGLNKMSLKKFERLVQEAGLQFEYRDYAGVKKLDPLTKLPVFRELFTNQVSCILQKP